MTTAQKRENLQKKMRKELSAGNFKKADELLKKIVEIDVKMLEKHLG